MSVLVSAQFQGSPGYAYTQPPLGYTQPQILGYYGQQYLTRPSIQYYNPGQALPRLAGKLPVKAAQTQQQQRQAWQRQIDQVKEKERQLRKKTALQSKEQTVTVEDNIKKPDVTEDNAEDT